jgi:hypothetical protein
MAKRKTQVPPGGDTLRSLRTQKILSALLGVDDITKPRFRRRLGVVVEAHRFFTVRSEMSRLVWSKSRTDDMMRELFELMDELSVMAKRAYSPAIRRAALMALSSSFFEPLLPILREMQEHGFGY